MAPENRIDNWQWATMPNEQHHRDRIALLRTVPYELTALVHAESEVDGGDGVVERQGKALSLNISSGGMLLLMRHRPDVERVIKIHVPTPVSDAKTPTLAEVRWIRPLPMDTLDRLYFVGMRFVV